MKLEILPRTDLAVRAVRLLAERPGATSASLAEILDTSPGYLTQILRPLVDDGFLETTRGPRGGYRLTDRGHQLSVLAVIECLEGPTDDGHCVMADSACDAGHPCSLHQPWTDARRALTDHLATVPVLST